MESGLRGRNNASHHYGHQHYGRSLNGVRPKRPEQFLFRKIRMLIQNSVSMESGLRGRNNCSHGGGCGRSSSVSMESGLRGRNNLDLLQLLGICHAVSMESGLRGRNNGRTVDSAHLLLESQWSPA